MQMSRAISIICLFGLLTISHGNVKSQADEHSAFFTGISYTTTNATWSADGQVFVFDGVSALPSIDSLNGEWFAYDINTNSLTQSQNWPLQLSLNQTTGISQQLAPQVIRGEEFVYLSPDGRFLLTKGQGEFHQSRNPRVLYSTVLADTLSDQVLEIPLAVPAANRDPLNFQVKWSDDSSAFTLATAPAFVTFLSHFSYISGYADEDQNLTVRDFSIFSYEGQVYNPQGIYDVSADGTLVLIQSPRGAIPEAPIFVWNVEADTYQKIDDLSPGSYLDTDAMFDPSGSGFYVINDHGLVHYDLETHDTEVVRSDINSTWVNRAFFSPDGQALILFDHTPDGLTEMYLVQNPF